MLLVNNERILTYKNKFYRCAYGKNGLVKNKIEGDECTPIGIFSLGKLYIRIDRIKDIKTNFKYQPITKTMAWSDDPKNQNYNKQINTSKEHQEKMYRKDHIYDLILVINYNINPTIPYKGSAIFIHIENNNYNPTQGCITLKKDDFIEILSTLLPNEKIKIIG